MEVKKLGINITRSHRIKSIKQSKVKQVKFNNSEDDSTP